MMRLLFAFSIFLAFIIVVATTSFAQEPQTPTAGLEQVYRVKLDEYRQAEDNYRIAEQQYYSLKTLKAQEEAVSSLRTVMLVRDEVLILYLDILSTRLKTDQGIEISRRERTLSEIELLDQDLKVHKTKVDLASDRPTMVQLTTDFLPFKQRFELIGDKGRALLRIGASQAALDQLTLITAEVTTVVESQQLPESQKLEKQRGFDEVKRLSEATRLSINESLRFFDTTTSTVADRVKEPLLGAFTSLNRSMEYIREIVQ